MVAQKMAAVVEEVHLTFKSKLKEETKVAHGQNLFSLNSSKRFV